MNLKDLLSFLYLFPGEGSRTTESGTPLEMIFPQQTSYCLGDKKKSRDETPDAARYGTKERFNFNKQFC